MRFCLALTLSLLTVATVQASVAERSGIDYRSAWECNQQKFNWYCDDVPDPPKKDTKKDVVKKKTEEEWALEEIARFRKELEGKRALAVLRPTTENIKAYIEAQQRLMRMGAVFSDTWMRTVWQTPDLNYELKRPVNNSAIEVYKQEYNKKRLGVIDALKNEWGIFFFFRSDCPYCHVMSRTLKLLTERYGLTIFPVSLDGGRLPEYPQPQIDNGMADRLGITVTPTMILGNPKTRQMVVLGTGVVSLDDIINRIYILTSTNPGDLY